MKILFKNLGIISIFIGILPFILMISEGFQMETLVAGIIFCLLGIALFYTNR